MLCSVPEQSRAEGQQSGLGTGVALFLLLHKGVRAKWLGSPG